MYARVFYFGSLQLQTLRDHNLCAWHVEVYKLPLNGLKKVGISIYWASTSGLRATDFRTELLNNADVVHAGRKAYLRLDDLPHKQNKDYKKCA